jgi:uncharacterized phage protein (TIGR02218 family)
MVTTVNKSIGTRSANISNVTYVGAVATITVPSGHGFLADEYMVVAGVVSSGTLAAGVNKDHLIDSVTATTIVVTLSGTPTGTYTSGGTVGRNYAGPTGWQTATSGNLVAADEKRVGHMYADSTFVLTDLVIFKVEGSTVDATRYRELKAGTGHRFNLYNNSGVLWEKLTTNTVDNGTAIIVNEDYFRFSGVGIVATNALSSLIPTAGDHYGVELRKVQGVKLDSIYVYWPVGEIVGADRIGGIYDSSATALQTGLEIRNCIVRGSGVDGLGLTIGIRVREDDVKIYNCLALDVRGGTFGSANDQGVGIGNDPDKPEVVRNCIAINSRDVDYLDADGDISYCISSDNTADPADTTNIQGQTYSNLFVNHLAQDFRNRSGSPSLQVGVDLSATFTTDFDGVSRTAPWDIGPYGGVYIPSTVAPTEIISTIGASGADYTTIQLWLAATRKNLVTANERHRGQLIDADYNLATLSAHAEGCITDELRYRVLEAAADNEYNPITETGAVVRGTAVEVLRVSEQFFRVEKICFKQESATVGLDRDLVVVAAHFTRFNRCVFSHLVGSQVTRRSCFYIETGTQNLVTNCIALGGTTTLGAHYGFFIKGVENRIYSCIANKMRQGTNATGFYDNGVAAGHDLANCISTFCDVCFDFEEMRYSISSDATATGFGSLIDQVQGDVFLAPLENDFRLVIASAARVVGANLSFYFTDDFTGQLRSLPWDIGAYAGVITYHDFKKQMNRNSHRFAILRRIQQVDGTLWLFTDSDHRIEFRGELYTPANAVAGSATAVELGFKEENVELFGILLAGGLTALDIMAGKLDDAKVNEYVVDWRYPFQEPFRERVRYLRDIEASAEYFRANLAGLASRLENPIGSLLSRNCDYELGDPTTCRKDMTALTSRGVPVTTIDNAYRVFRASSLIDRKYPLGKVLFETGLNAGLTFEIKAWDNATKQVGLQRETPYAIAVSDEFTITPGCDGRSVSCEDDYDNFLNFGGYLNIPRSKRYNQVPSV